MTLGGIGSAYDSAQGGMTAAMGRLADAAVAVSSEPSVEGIVDMKGAETQLAASVVAVKSMDESLGTLIDELA